MVSLEDIERKVSFYGSFEWNILAWKAAWKVEEMIDTCLQRTEIFWLISGFFVMIPMFFNKKDSPCSIFHLGDRYIMIYIIYNVNAGFEFLTAV